MPGTAAPAGRRLIIATQRNEGAFLLEWLAWHRLIGFSDFLIYSNDCADGSDAMLDRLAALGLLTHRRNPREGRKSVQWQALGRAGGEALLAQADWVMALDLDEFLLIHAGAGRLDDLFAAAPGAEAFAIDWRMFGNGGQQHFAPGLVTARFTRAAPERLVWPWRAVQFKTLFANRGLQRLGVHQPRFRPGHRPAWHDGNGLPVAPPRGTVRVHDGPRHGLAQVNHYALGSAEDFLLKCARGRPNRSDLPIGLDYWAERNFDAAEDRRLAERAPELQRAVGALLADAELARLQAQAVAWRRQAIAELTAQLGPFYLLSALQALGPAQVLPMAQQQARMAQLYRILRAQDAGSAQPVRAAPDHPEDRQHR